MANTPETPREEPRSPVKGDVIRQLREYCRLTRDELREASGVSVSVIARAEASDPTVSYKTLQRILAGLHDRWPDPVVLGPHFGDLEDLPEDTRPVMADIYDDDAVPLPLPRRDRAQHTSVAPNLEQVLLKLDALAEQLNRIEGHVAQNDHDRSRQESS